MRLRLRIDRLQQLLASSRLSQNHWAIKVGLSRGHWSDLVNGRHPYPSAKTRQAMVEAFQVTPEELFEIEPLADDLDIRAAISDRYLVDRELGSGAMGNVYLARDVARGRVVALKTISAEAASGVGVAALAREIGAMSQLQHPNIVPVFDSGSAGECAFLVMPWIRDGSLRDRIRKERRLTLGGTIEILRGVAAALDHAHAEQRLHCDLKPENILLQGNHAYLADFGISRVLHIEASEYRSRGTLDTSAGTPAYVSPEQAAGEEVGPASDIYSMACVAWEMLAGQPPFEGTTTLEIVSGRFAGAPPLLSDAVPGVATGVAEVLMQAMSLSPTERPGSAREFVDALTAAVSDPKARHAGRAVPSVRRMRRRVEVRLATLPGIAAIGEVRRELSRVLRGIWRSPRYLVGAVVPLGLGLGAGGAFLGLVDHLYFRPPPGVRAAAELSRLVIEAPDNDGRLAPTNSVAWIDYQTVRTQVPPFADVAAFFTRRAGLGRGQDAEPVMITEATASFFTTLGARPALGRFFHDAEDVRANTAAPCVVSHRLWLNRFGGQPSALGRAFDVGAVRCTVIGVTEPGFRGIDLTEVDLWLPIQSSAPTWQGLDENLWTTDNSHWVRVVARLSNGVGLADTRHVLAEAYRAFPQRGRDRALAGRYVAEPVHAARGSLRSAAAQQALLLGWASGILLLLIVTNMVNAVMARDLGRSRETAMHLALGGGVVRLWRAKLVEVTTLALGGIMLGFLVMAWLSPVIRRTLFSATAWSPAAIDVRVVTLTGVLAGAIALIVAGFGAWAATRRELAQVLRVGGATADRRALRIRSTLVAVQAALTLILLTGALAFVQSFRRATAVDVGFDVSNVIALRVPFTEPGLDRAVVRSRYEQLRLRVLGVPGVDVASLAYMDPWNNNSTMDVFSATRDSLRRVPLWGAPLFDVATVEHQRVMGLQMREGRWFRETDGSGAPPVVVVNAAFVRHYWGDTARGAGRCVRLGADTNPCREIIGVTRDFRMAGALEEPVLPAAVIPDAQRGDNPLSSTLFVRVSAPSPLLLATLRRVVQGAVPGTGAASIQPVEDNFRPLVARFRTGAVALTCLGIVAVVVALGGLYAVLSFQVAQRRQEFAVRVALGGRGHHVARSVVLSALRSVGAGMVAGLMVLAAAAPRIQAQLFATSLLEPGPLLVTCGLCLGMAWLAAWLPAREAAGQDPMLALRGG